MIFNQIGGGTSTGVRVIEIPVLGSGQYSFQVDLGVDASEIESIITNVSYINENLDGYLIIKAGIYDAIRIRSRNFTSQPDFLRMSNVSGTLYEFTANSGSGYYIKYFSGKKMFLLLK